MTKFLTLLAFIAIVISCDKPVAHKQTLVLVAFEDTSQTGGWGFKDTSGQVVIPAEYSMVLGDSFINDIAFVVKKSDGKDDAESGIIAIDKNNKFVLKPFIFDNGPDYLQEGLFRFTENGNIGFADIDGKKVIPSKYTFAEPFQEGFSAFCEGCKKENMGEHWRMVGGKWGFMDKNGKEILAAEYDVVTNFKDGIAEVTKKGEKMRINPKGEVVK